MAFLSHFALDMLPHFDEAGIAKHLSVRQHVALLVSDGLLAIGVGITAIMLTGLNPFLGVTAGIMSMLPDLMWLPYYVNGTIHNVDTYGPLAKLHKRMQRQEKPWGLGVEILWFIALCAILYTLTRG